MQALLEPHERRAAETLRDLVAYAIKRDAAELVTVHEFSPLETARVMQHVLPFYTPANASPALLVAFDGVTRRWIEEIYQELHRFYAEKVEDCAGALTTLGMGDPPGTWEAAVRGLRRELGGDLPPAAVLDKVLREDLKGFFGTPRKVERSPEAGGGGTTSLSAADGADGEEEGRDRSDAGIPAGSRSLWNATSVAVCRDVTECGYILAKETATTTAAPTASATPTTPATTSAAADATPSGATTTPSTATADAAANTPTLRIPKVRLSPLRPFHLTPIAPAGAPGSSSSPPESAADDLPCGQKRGLPAEPSQATPTPIRPSAFQLTPPAFSPSSPYLFTPTPSPSPSAMERPGDRPPERLLRDEGEELEGMVMSDEEDDEAMARLMVDPVSPLSGPQIPLTATHRLQKTKMGTLSKKDWRLEPRRKVLLMGDSNLSRLPPIADGRIQVDSFPGATLYQAASILGALSGPYRMVRRVVLAFGVCDKNSATRETFRRNLKTLAEAAEKEFPGARVYVAEIAYNPRALLPAEVERLAQFNQEIRRRPFYLASPRPEEIHTVDPVHWTSETAALVWSTWRVQLGLVPLPSPPGVAPAAEQKEDAQEE